MPGALREWIEVVEGQNPDRREGGILKVLRKRLEGATPQERRLRAGALLSLYTKKDVSFMSDFSHMQRAFPDSFGRSEFRWDEDASPIEWVLATVDCFVSLMEPLPIPACLTWTHTTVILEPVGWACGGLHKPEVVERWRCMPECSRKVLRWVEHKFDVPPVKPVPHFRKKNALCLRPSEAGTDNKTFDKVKSAFVTEKHAKEVKQDVVCEGNPWVCSPLNVVPKSTKPFMRIIANMRELNEYFPHWYMKFDDLRMYKHLFRPSHFMFNLDQHAAYHTIMAHPRLARMFGFEWNGKTWFWKCLPFGFRLSPFVFCKVVRQLVKMWRRRGVNVLAFVDDQASGEDNFFKAVLTRNTLIRDNLWFGFDLSAKSVPLPFQRMHFLGLIQHHACPTPSFHVPEEKMTSLQAAAVALAQQPVSNPTRSQVVAPKLAVTFCSGSCAFGVSHAIMHPSIIVICVDMERPEFFLPHIDKRGIANLRFKTMDVREVSLDVMRGWAREFGSGSLQDMEIVQASPSCKTLSECSGGMAVWDPVLMRRTPHRDGEGRPLSSMAVLDDSCLDHLFELLFEFLEACPRALVHVENPLSRAWPTLAPVRRAVERGAVLFRADHCRMASELDLEVVFSQKPTLYLAFNVVLAPESLERWVCVDTTTCPFRSRTNPHVHAIVVRNKKGLKEKGQVCQPIEIERSRIPLGVFEKLWGAHVAWRGQHSVATVGESLVIPKEVIPRSVAKVAGRALSMGLALGPACRLMSRELFAALHGHEDFDWDRAVPGTEGLLRELLWLATHVASWNDVGTPIWGSGRVIDVQLTQDSSPSHVGYRMSDVVGGHKRDKSVPLTVTESRLDHVHREMVGAVLAVSDFARRLDGRSVQLRVDSRSTVKYLRDGGGKSRFMTRLARICFAICIRHRISLTPAWIPGTAMVECGVDGLSRPRNPAPLTTRDRDEWRLDPEWFRWLQSELSTRCGLPGFTCDRFADRANTQVGKFCARIGQLGALHPPNALAHEWHGEFNYAFPPQRLLAPTLQYALEQGCWVAVVMPQWARDWYPALLKTADRVFYIPGWDHFLRPQNGEFVRVHKQPFRPMVAVFLGERQR
jgi:hypothetical protein